MLWAYRKARCHMQTREVGRGRDRGELNMARTFSVV